MILKKFISPFLLALTLIYSCKKSSNDTVGTNPGDDSDDCIQTNAVLSNDTLENQYIVVYKASAEENRTINLQGANELNRKLLERNRIGGQALRKSFEGRNAGFVARLSTEEANRLAQDETVAAIEHDRIISLGACFTVAAPRLVTWNITRVGYGNGIGKRAWIIDTGIDFDHPDLTVDTIRSKSFISGQSSAEDENGHGTHVAGIIGARNNEFGVLGVASGATLVSLRVLDKDGKGLLSNMVNALVYVSNNASAGDVVNMSVGEDEGTSTTLDQTVKNTAAKGIFISIAAGNEKSMANKYSPARTNAPNVYTVSAVDSLDNFASFSNYGNDVVDYAAPGVRILSTFINGQYAYMGGTSMAAPHVAGLLLLKGTAIGSNGSAKNDPDGQADLIAHY